MRILVTGDWHPDVVTLGVSRFDEVEAAAEETVAAAIHREVDLYAFLGDLADPDSGGNTLRAINLMIKCALDLSAAGIPSVWIAGNHDVVEDGTGATTITPLRAIAEVHPDIFVVEHARVLGFRDQDDEVMNAIIFPYPSATVTPTYVDEQARSFVKEFGRRYIVLGHLMISSAQKGSETTELPRGREVSFPIEATSSAVARFNGHYHKRQITPENIIIPGSLARLTFGEGENEPSYLVVDV